MHRIESMLLGIALILFGIASILIATVTHWGFFEVIGIIFPFLGLFAAIIGVFYNGGSGDNNE